MENNLAIAMEHLMKFVETAKEDIPKQKNLTEEQRIEFEKQWEKSNIEELKKEIKTKFEQSIKNTNGK